MTKMGRTTYVDKAVNELEEALAKLGDVKAQGQQLQALNEVFERLTEAQEQLYLAKVGAA